MPGAVSCSSCRTRHLVGLLRHLIGQPAELLLAGGLNANGFNPFRVTAPVRRRAAWLKRADGSSILLAFSAAPLSDAEGRIVGTRGMGIDWTEFDESAGRVAASLRRGEVLDHILWRMGHEVFAPRMMQAALDALMNALGAEGAAVIELRSEEGAVMVHRAGRDGDELLVDAAGLLAMANGPMVSVAKNGRPILAAVCRTRLGRRRRGCAVALTRLPRLGRRRHAADQRRSRPHPDGAGT